MAFTFLRWQRTGMAASLGDQPLTAGAAARAKLSVGVELGATGLQGKTATTNLDVLGPGDVAGIDPRQVIRMFPVPATLDFEPTYLAHVEFDRPDLPWLFTPFGPSAAGTLRPWICLVVVETGENTELVSGPPPRLRVTPPEVAKLPALADAHAWTHVQITGDATRGAEAITKDEPERILSRLVCPRVLSAGKSYLACVVPTFKVGALAGLGREVPATVGPDAWSLQDAIVELPVYHFWEFSTGGEGDFQSLVLRLKSPPELPGVGTRELDVTDPGFGVEERPDPATVEIGGALRVDPPAEPPVDAVLASDLEPVVNTTDAVGPPIYGRWHAAADSVSGSGTGTLGWLDGLNLDPRYRVSAGLGTLVVQERQEDLMAAIWEQLGEILRANQLLRQAQLAVAASERILARHLTPLSDQELLAIAGPALSRIRIAPGRTARREVVESCLPLLALSGAFRKIVRAHGPLERRLAKRALTSDSDRPPAVTPPTIDVPTMFDALANGSLAPPPVQLASGAVPLPSEALPIRSWSRPGRPGVLARRPPLRERGQDSSALGELAQTFATLAARAPGGPCAPLDSGALAATVRAQLDPDLSVAGRARAQVKVPASNRVRLSSRLDPIMAAPEIPTPMFGPLREISSDWVLPGVDEIPPNSFAIAEPDAAFIEAYMVGLNHEIGRELLWRGFPTDQRGTVFSRFWDRRGSVSTAAAPVPDRDIPPINEWDPKLPLGENLETAGLEVVVLLIRGDLLQRYPLATIYMQRGHWNRDPRGAVTFKDDLAVRSPVPLSDERSWARDTRFPIFRGRAGADITFLGFPLSKLDVRGIERGDAKGDSEDEEAGWYVVFEEQPTEPRFSKQPAPSPLSSDTLAAAQLRQAFRLFVHASDLVPE